MADLQIIDIEKHYGTTRVRDMKDFGFSLKDIHVTVKEGEFFSLLGPSGCGKTTLLKLVAGLLQPDKGDIFLGSKRMTSLLPEERGFGMVFQQALLFPHMTVEENVAFGLKMQKVKKKERLHKAQEMLGKVGLEGYGPRYPSALSGGQQQRVSFARALVTRPRLLLMDEPFSALDPGLREEMRELVRKIHKEFQVTILFVTHDRDEAFQLSDRIGIMKEGKLLQAGSPQELYGIPNHPDVAMFLGAKNVIQGYLDDGYFISPQLKTTIRMKKNMANARGWLVIRPETMQPVKIGDQDTVSKAFCDTCFLQGTVRQTSFRQGFHYLKVEVGSKLLDVIYQLKVPAASLEMGEEIRLYYNPEQLSFIIETAGKGT